MPSQAFLAFASALDEVEALGAASHPSLAPTHPGSLRLARAVGRGQVVLLSSHFERFIYALNEELVSFVNTGGFPSNMLSQAFRLQYSASAIDDLASTGWEKRARQLAEFAAEDAWLWTEQISRTLNHSRLLAWMKAPSPKNLVRYFRLWDVDDVFTKITRKSTSRQVLWLSVQGLVDLRNNIAHGDYLAQATEVDVRVYAKQISEFCRRADRMISKVVAKNFHVAAPW